MDRTEWVHNSHNPAKSHPGRSLREGILRKTAQLPTGTRMSTATILVGKIEALLAQIRTIAVGLAELAETEPDSPSHHYIAIKAPVIRELLTVAQPGWPDDLSLAAAGAAFDYFDQRREAALHVARGLQQTNSINPTR